MKVAIQIPIKSRSSTRVPNKNFRELVGKPLSYWLLDELEKHCPNDWDIFIDSESSRVLDKLADHHRKRFKFHLREEWFASDGANGNHLLSQFAVANPHYDIFAQAFVTAVSLTGNAVVEAIRDLSERSDKYDSLFLATRENGWVWYNGKAVNYDPSVPDGLPRSQDAQFFLETTGLYVVTKDSLFRNWTRIGKQPLLFEVPKDYGIDIDTLEDLQQAREFLQNRELQNDS